MSMDKQMHTATPWQVVSGGLAIFPVKGDKYNGPIIAQLHNKSGVITNYEANAAFIVEACNAYESLTSRVAELEGERNTHNAAYASQMREIVALKEQIAAMQSVCNAASICVSAWSSEDDEREDCMDEELELEEAVNTYRAALPKSTGGAR